MLNSGGNIPNNTIFQELSNGNAELGEAFALDLHNMVKINGLPNPNALPFEITPTSWKTLVKKTDKTPEEIKKLDTVLINSIYEIAESYLLFICRKMQNKTGKINYQEYEKYILESKYIKAGILNNPQFLNKVKNHLTNAFKKISAHGEETGGDDLIDKHDMASYIYAIMNKTKRENDKFSGFEIDGSIDPKELSLCESLLFEPENNMMSLKLRIGYKFLKGEL